LETKALHTAVEAYLSQSGDKVPEQNAVSSSSPSATRSS